MSKGRYTRRRKSPSPLYYIALCLLLAVFAGSSWYLIRYYAESKEQASRYDELLAIVEGAKTEAPDSGGTSGNVPGIQQSGQENDDPDGSEPAGEATESGGILPEYRTLYEMNPDLAGWIRIDGTNINYPVMQTPDSPDYYLTRNFDRQNSAHGCIYAKEECDLEEPSDNITIYGHHMQDGSMFAGLDNFADEDYWQEHRYIQLDTLTERHTYEIFAVFRTTASVGQGFAYHNFIDAGDEAEFYEFIENCLTLSIYDTGIVPVYGDKLICLSTCEYTRTNGRFVVAAVRIS